MTIPIFLRPSRPTLLALRWTSVQLTPGRSIFWQDLFISNHSREGRRHTKNSVVEGLLILGELTVDGVGAGDIRGEALVLRHETQGRKHTSVPISQRTISPSSILRSLGAPTYQRTGRETYPRDRSGEWRCFCRYRRCQRRRRVCWRTCCSRRTSHGGEEAPNTLCMASSWNSYMPGLQEAMASR